MDLGGLGWGLQTIIGAALFVIVVLWVVLRNRKNTTPEDVRRSEEATHRLYEEEDRAHGHESDNVP